MGRRAVVVVLIAVLAAPGTLVRAAAGEALVAGAVTLDARPLAGARIAFIELATGAVSRTVTGADGSYRASLPAGSYAVVAAEGRPDLALRRAPARLTLPPGGRATADLELQAVPGTAPPAQPSARPAPSAARANRPLIEHQAVGCFVVRQCAQVQAHIRATPGVSRARGYFRSANSPWYSVDMERVPPAGGTGDTFVATLPGARDPGPLTYYLSAVAADGSEERSPEIVAQVVTSAAQCGAGAEPPPAWTGTVTVLGSTDVVVQPAEFNDCSDTAAPLVTSGRHIDKRLIGLLAGAAAAGIGLAIAIGDEPATPSR